jgi:hypothetical protein
MTWPIADVPAPPAVIEIAPSVAMLPARLPATPPEVVVVEPKAGRAVTTPEVTVVERTLGTSSPSIYDSEYEKLSPAVVTLKAPGV